MARVQDNPPNGGATEEEIMSKPADYSFVWTGDPSRFGVKLFRLAKGPWSLTRASDDDETVPGKGLYAAYTGHPIAGNRYIAGCAEVPPEAISKDNQGNPTHARIKFNNQILEITTQQPPDNCV